MTEKKDQLIIPVAIENNRSIFFANLDGLRFVAFALVFVQHIFYFFANTLQFTNAPLSRFLRMCLLSGETGVSIFFVLSGFLITYLLLTEKEATNTIGVFKFYMRRALRIWPLYYLVLIFAFIIFPQLKAHFGTSEQSHADPLYFYTFFSNFNVIHNERLYQGHNNAIEGITWSVAVEEQFYLIWPLLFISVPKKLYKFIFPVCIFASLLFRYSNRNDDITLYYHTFSVISDMVIGGFCAYLAFYNKKFKAFFENIDQKIIYGMYLLGTVWLMYSAVLFTTLELKIFIRLVSAIFFTFVIMEQNYAKNSFYKFSNNKFFSFWGKYTYGLYLLHEIVITLVIILMRLLLNWRESSDLEYNIVKGIGAFILSLTVSYISYQYFESPFLKFKNKFAFNRIKSHP